MLPFFNVSERNELSFIETSALDSTNVEAAFQNILTGKWHGSFNNIFALFYFLVFFPVFKALYYSELFWWLGY